MDGISSSYMVGGYEIARKRVSTYLLWLLFASNLLALGQTCVCGDSTIAPCVLCRVLGQYGCWRLLTGLAKTHSSDLSCPLFCCFAALRKSTDRKYLGGVHWPQDLRFDAISRSRINAVPIP